MNKDTASPHRALPSAPMPAKHTIYVLVRQDIGLAQQLVQSAHAGAESGRRFYRPEHGIARLVVLSVANEQALLAARERLSAKGLETELFFEPDFGMGYSALATQPLINAQRKHLMGWPLWRAPKAAEPSAKEGREHREPMGLKEPVSFADEKDFVAEMA